MFRKKRSSSVSSQQSHASQTPTSSAASAAALAFLKKQKSDANLSSAAAAAALRAHTASPEPVGNIQTKRMVRRGSTSSYGSPHGSMRQPMQRRTSNGSMTERTFRSPSPSLRNTGPLPIIPDDIPPIPQKSHKRPASVASVDQLPPIPGQNASNVGKPVARSGSLSQRPQSVAQPGSGATQRQGQPNAPRSVNFSRPMSPPPAPSARMVQEVERTRPASSLGFRQNEPPQQRPLSIAAMVRSSNAKGGIPQSRPQSSAGPAPALAAASLAARPAPATPPSNTASRSAAPRPQSIHATTPAPGPTQTAARPAIKTAQPVSKAASGQQSQSLTGNVQNNTPPPSASTIPSPSAEQIKNFQTRAAAHLARPLSQPVAKSNDQTSASIPAATKSTAQGTTPQVRAISPSQQLQVTGSGPSPTASKPTHAHFSSSPMLDAIRHDPLPRAASPAKSALKSSSRGNSPAPPAMSDTSDARSNASDDGHTVPPKKKKGVRVSFDEQTELVGVSTSNLSPMENILSPQYTKAEHSLDFDDTAMTPRPALPSFGSVRGDRSPTTEKASSDHAVGAVISRDFVEKREPQTAEPKTNESSVVAEAAVPTISVLPATPMIGNENRELTDSSITEPATESVQVPSAGDSSLRQASEPSGEPATSRSGTGPQAAEDEGSNAITGPASPGEDSDDTAELYEDAAEEPSDIDDEPTGFASLDAIIESPTAEEHPESFAAPDSSALPAPVVPAVAEKDVSAVPGPVADPSGEEDWERVRAYWSSLSVQRKQQIEQEAAEHLKQQQTGVASGEVIPGKYVPPNSSSATAPAPVSRQPAASSTQIAKQTASKPSAATAPAAKPAAKTVAKPPTVKAPVAKPTTQSTHQRAASEPTHMKSSMRNTPAAPTGGMRMSMRDTGDKQRPLSSLGANLPSSRPTSALSTNRPTSAAGSSSTQTPASGAAASNATAIAMARAMARPNLSRKDSSDSESSFRRKRRGSVTSSDGNKYSMRKSMRSAAAEPRPTSPTPSRGSRFSMRSPSPSLKNTGLRSGRDSVESDTPTLRGSQQSSSKRSSFLGLGKSSRSKPPKVKVSSAFKSRYGDSSDEDEMASPVAARPAFRSRFDDSDDEETSPVVASSLRPVRGIPRKHGQASGESTDLSESEDEGGAPQTKVTAPTTAAPASIPSTPIKHNGAAKQGTSLSVGTLRTNVEQAPSSPSSPKGKRGFFGLGKRRSVMADIPGSPSSPVAPAPSSPTVTKAANIPSATAASQTDASQSPAPAAAAASPSNTRAGAVTPTGDRTRKMFRRFSSSTSNVSAAPPKENITNENFEHPVPPIPKEYLEKTTNESTRPQTSDGGERATSVRQSMRPALGDKRHSTLTAQGDRAVIVSQRSGKPKKFQGLRRFLGVQD